ncbi:vitronectin a isoform X1 [Narcine bancroftii]|uniref:vitronectin a isoform X1 n=1 Tax=Narcine bancroftii TaxID=1343680 RepID=UPI003831BD00
MKLLVFLIITSLSHAAIDTIDKGSCIGRCDLGFQPSKRCQCDTMCSFYHSCCHDFQIVCEKRRYFYELDTKGIIPGYPKLIQDVWGVEGPIDAAFTRINCEGKTYLFKGKLYWRFNNGILESNFPKPILEGFPGIPSHLNAALALPASDINGKERIYFFKGTNYWEYVFFNQPSHNICATTSISISIPLERYTMAKYMDVPFFRSTQRDITSGPFSISQDWVGLPPHVDSAMIGKLFVTRQYIHEQSDKHGRRRGTQHGRRRGTQHGRRRGTQHGRRRGTQHGRRRGTQHGRRRGTQHGRRRGTQHGRRRGTQHGRRRGTQHGRRRGTQHGRRRQDHNPLHWRPLSSWERDDFILVPTQNVYFFVRDKYYCVDFITKQVAFVWPPYPRSIAKYWFKCEDRLK